MMVNIPRVVFTTLSFGFGAAFPCLTYAAFVRVFTSFCRVCQADAPGRFIHSVARLRKQFGGVIAGRLGGVESGHHPGQLIDAGLAGHLGDPRCGDLSVVGLVNDELPVREGCHLREMGDNNHLRLICQPCQPAANLDSHGSSHPGVHFVEHKCVARIGSGQHDLKRKAHS